MAHARAQLDKLLAGAREEEVAAARANVAGARAELLETEKVYARDKDLVERGATSQSQLDLAMAKPNPDSPLCCLRDWSAR